MNIAVIYADRNSRVMDAAKRSSVGKLNASGFGFISALNRHVYPPAIFRAIPCVVVDAVKAQFRAKPVCICPVNKRPRVVDPLIANGNPSICISAFSVAADAYAAAPRFHFDPPMVGGLVINFSSWPFLQWMPFFRYVFCGAAARAKSAGLRKSRFQYSNVDSARWAPRINAGLVDPGVGVFALIAGLAKTFGDFSGWEFVSKFRKLGILLRDSASIANFHGCLEKQSAL